MHTFSLTAHCPTIVTVESVDSLQHALHTLGGSPFFVLGEGSNTVFIEDYKSTILLNKIVGIERHEDNDNHYLCVGAGENWHKLVAFCMAHNIGGFENLALIPGTVGAAPIQNIGAYGVEIERFIEKVEFLDTSTLSINHFTHQECEFGYRDSIFKRQAPNARIITRVFFTLPKQYMYETSYGPLASLAETGKASAKTIYDAVIDVRSSKLPDPNELGNAGSFFKNPVISNNQFQQLSANHKTSDIPHYIVNDTQVKIPAAWLIDQLGFKGKRVGDIGCHVNQPLVLVNFGQGKGSDVLRLAREIKQAVYDNFAIILENEVRLIGNEGLLVL